MLNETTTARIRSKISDYHTLNVSDYNPEGLELITKYVLFLYYHYPCWETLTYVSSRGTAQIVTADAEGMAVALTTTVNDFFGSQVMVPETGVIMNNEMNDFSSPGSSTHFGFIPSAANFITPGKRPLSSIVTMIVESIADSSLYLVTGAAGGSHIITAAVENVVSILDQCLTAPQALAKPRFHDQLQPNQIVFDYPFDNRTVNFMKSRGHNVTWAPPGFALVQTIRRLPNSTFEAASDPHLINGGGYSI